MKFNFFAFLILVLISLINCETADDIITDPLNDLEWLQAKKNDLDSQGFDYEIAEYRYNKEQVFFFDCCLNCSDIFSFVYNVDGHEICEFGAELEVNTCQDFFKNATFQKSLYKYVDGLQTSAGKIIDAGDIAADGCGWLFKQLDSYFSLENLPDNFKIDGLRTQLAYTLDENDSMSCGLDAQQYAVMDVESVLGYAGVKISGSKYEQDSPSEYKMSDVKIIGDLLLMTIHAGGCSGYTWQYDLYDAGVVMESMPPQRLLKLHLTDEEDCKAYIGTTVAFNLEKLQGSEGSVYLHIDGYDETILYTYK